MLGRGAGGGRKAGSAAPAPRPAFHAGDEFVDALTSVSRGISDPVAKLRYLRSSIARHQSSDAYVRAVPWSPVRRLMYRWLSLESLRHLMGGAGGGRIPIDTHTRIKVQVGRTLTVGAAAALSLVGLLALAYYLTRPQSAPVVAANPAPAPPLPPADASPLSVVAPELLKPAGVKPADIWQVEKGEGWELYSNGLRIDTRHAVAGDPRRHRTFRRGQGLGEEVGDKPVGLLFHTSESDVWPLEESYNENLRDSSQRLVRYIQRNRLYNYLVDRFGRVYRIVQEETKANHAGYSIWAVGDEVYLNLNHAFLGVSFETRWEGGRALPITEAQFAAGRSLSEYLRQRWSIPPERCVTHGLTSVNPKKHLIGHHMDWARGFPFEAFGLPDQYNRPAPSVALFGFGYDEDFLKVLPEPWEGVKAAEREMAEEAGRRGVDVAAVRRERQELYDRWLSEQTQDQQASELARAEPARPRGPRGG